MSKGEKYTSYRIRVLEPYRRRTYREKTITLNICSSSLAAGIYLYLHLDSLESWLNIKKADMKKYSLNFRTLTWIPRFPLSLNTKFFSTRSFRNALTVLIEGDTFCEEMRTRVLITSLMNNVIECVLQLCTYRTYEHCQCSFDISHKYQTNNNNWPSVGTIVSTLTQYSPIDGYMLAQCWHYCEYIDPL